MKNRLASHLLLPVLFLLCAITSVNAQTNEYWKVIGDFQMKSHEPDELGNTQGFSGWGITCAYFWDENRGLVGLGNHNLDPYGFAEIWRTTNGGGTWEKSLMPPLADTERTVSDFYSIWMRDTLVGWAVLNHFYSRGPIDVVAHSILLRTNDGGRSWQKEKVANWPEHLFSRAKQLPSGRMVLANDVAIVDNRIAIANHVAGLGDGLFRTLNGGVTWEKLHDEFTALTIYYDPSSRLLFASSYNGNFKPPLKSPKIHTSKDLGVTWDLLTSDDPFHTNLHIDGSGRAIYLQASPGYQFLIKEGFYRSMNGGKNWKHVEGPNRASWTRFHVPQTCNGALVVGFDSNKVWMTTAGGDGTIRLTHPPILNVHLSEAKTSCDSQIVKIAIDNIQCSTYVFTSAELKKAEGVFVLDSSGVLPINIAESGHGELNVKFWPQRRTGQFEDSLILRGYEETKNGKRYFDTVVHISATSLAVAPELTADNAMVNIPLTSTCFARDTTITITNTGCDTLTLDNASGSGSAFSYSNVSVPTKLAPGASVKVIVTFHPPTDGTHNGNLQLTATQQGVTTQTSVSLTGSGVYGEGLLELLSATDVKIPELNFCAPGTDTVASIRNTGCDTLIIKDVTVTGSSDYSLATAVQNAILAPDSMFRFPINFTPQGKGARTGVVTINWTDERGGNPKEAAITFGANVTDGAKVLTTTSSTFDFGDANICVELDSTITFTNDGCDTLMITGADVDQHFVIEGTYPVTLAPGQSIDLPLTTIVDTAGKPTRLTGNLSLASTADQPLPPIVVTRGLIYPTRLRLEVIDDARGKDGDIVKFKILLEGDVPISLSELQFDLIHNNDLLGFVRLVSDDLSITSTIGNDRQTQRFTLSQIRGAGVLGEVWFKAFVAEAEETILSFDNISFDAVGVSFAPECLAVISDTSSRFDFVYSCGDRMIRDLIKGISLIKSITPNPAKDEIHLELADGLAEVEVAIIDMLGVEVQRLMTSGRIDVTALTSGMYYLRVIANGTVQTRLVVISK